MKAALVTARLSTLGGGVSAVVEALSAHLARRENDIEVIGLRDALWNDACGQWRGAPVSAHAVIGPATFGFSPDAAAALESFNPEVVHTHGLWTYPSHAVARWSARRKRPYIVSPHGMLDPWAVHQSRLKKGWAKWLYENRHLRGAHCLHALCEAEAAAIRAAGLTNPISVIPNGVDLPGEVPDCAPPWVDHVPHDANVLFYLGRLHPKKNLLAFLDAWASRARPGWHLVIGGWDQDGHADALKAMVGRNAHATDVHFIGQLFGRDKDAAFRNARAFVLPSLSEGLPMAVLEAWSYGLPVLMSDACNLPSGFSNHAAMRLSSSPQGMAEDLSRFLHLDGDALIRMGRNGRRLVETDFCWGRVAERMLEIYHWAALGGTMPATVRVV